MGILSFFKHGKKNRVTLEGGLGDSVENAVIIHCSDYLAGSRAEYKYLEEKCGQFITDWSLDVKMLIKRNGRNYDLIGIKMEDGTKRTFYFDSTEMLKCLNLELFSIKEK
jgi:hypothetical protein